LSFEQIQISEIPEVDVLFFSSKRAVDFLLKQQIVSARVQVACIGSVTKHYLEDRGILVDFVGSNSSRPQEVSKELYRWLNGRTCGLVTAEESQRTIATYLDESLIYYITPYRTVIHPDKLDSPMDVLVFTSPSNVKGFLQKNEIHHQKVVAWGKTTEEFLLKNAIQNVYCLNNATEKEVISYLEKLF
jgi:uroporphyrinogen-III synthase